MTGTQIQTAKNALPPYKERNEEQNLLSKELSCRDMINSIMIYGNINSPYDERTQTFNHFLDSYVNEDGLYPLGTKRVLELIREQQKDFAKAKVRYNVYTDSEGCTYNSCLWEDDIP